jgi:pilus assembly protein CpaB
MSNSRALLISAVIAGVALLMVYSYVSDKEEEIKKRYGEEVVVLTANQDIKPLQNIQPDMLLAVSVPKQFLQPGYIPVDERESLFIEATTIASTSILRGEQITKTKLLFDVLSTGLSTHVSVGKRAVTLPVNDIKAVNRLIKPGNRVDLVASIPVRKENRQEISTFVFLQDVPLLATGDFIQSEIPRDLKVDPVSLEQQVEDLRKQKTFTNITIEVNPEEVNKIVWLLSSNAEIYLSLRNNNDRRIHESIKSISEADLIPGTLR